MVPYYASQPKCIHRNISQTKIIPLNSSGDNIGLLVSQQKYTPRSISQTIITYKYSCSKCSHDRNLNCDSIVNSNCDNFVQMSCQRTLVALRGCRASSRWRWKWPQLAKNVRGRPSSPPGTLL